MVDDLRPEFTKTYGRKAIEPYCVSLAWSADGGTLFAGGLGEQLWWDRLWSACVLAEVLTGCGWLFVCVLRVCRLHRRHHPRVHRLPLKSVSAADVWVLLRGSACAAAHVCVEQCSWRRWLHPGGAVFTVASVVKV